MYDKLGELLTEAIETNNFPKSSQKEIENSKQTENLYDSNFNQNANSQDNQNNSQNKTETSKIKFKIFTRNSAAKKHTGSIIKSEDIEIPEEIKSAFKILKLDFTNDIGLIKKQYRKLMLKYHPDTVDTKASNPKIVLELRQKQTQQLTEAYKKIEEYFKNKN